jgi:ribosome-associated protein
MRLDITEGLSVPLCDIEMTAIRAQGPGGQNVNKVATAIHLRFDIHHSSLPEFCRHRLLASGDQRITRDGVIVIKAQHGRSQQQSKAEALRRLQEMLVAAMAMPTVRRATAPGLGAKRRRLEQKSGRGMQKALRAKVVV